jgi:hypothetical protein
VRVCVCVSVAVCVRACAKLNVCWKRWLCEQGTLPPLRRLLSLGLCHGIPLHPRSAPAKHHLNNFRIGVVVAAQLLLQGVECKCHDKRIMSALQSHRQELRLSSRDRTVPALCAVCRGGHERNLVERRLTDSRAASSSAVVVAIETDVYFPTCFVFRRIADDADSPAPGARGTLWSSSSRRRAPAEATHRSVDNLIYHGRKGRRVSGSVPSMMYTASESFRGRYARGNWHRVQTCWCCRSFPPSLDGCPTASVRVQLCRSEDGESVVGEGLVAATGNERMNATTTSHAAHSTHRAITTVGPAADSNLNLAEVGTSLVRVGRVGVKTK